MVAGLNLVGKIWRYTASSYDDDIGGAQPSGTIVYDNVSARIDAQKPTMALVEQGLETQTIFVGVLHPGNMRLESNDEFEVVSPSISHHYGKKYRIIGIQEQSTHPADSRQFVMVTLRRVEKSRAVQ